MRKHSVGVAWWSGAVLVSSLAPLWSAPRVTVNGKSVQGVAPYVSAGEVMVPVRGVIEKIPGMGVQWDAQRRQIRLSRGGTRVTMSVGSGYAHVNGQDVPMARPVAMREGRVLMPLRFVSEVLGAKVSYDTRQRLVSIWAKPGEMQTLGYRGLPADSKKEETGRVALGGEVLLTFTNPGSCSSLEERVSQATERINDGLAQAGPQRYGKFHPSSVWLARAQGNPVLMLGKTAITEVTPDDAKADRMTQQALAEKWAARMRRILSQAYNG